MNLFGRGHNLENGISPVTIEKFIDKCSVDSSVQLVSPQGERIDYWIFGDFNRASGYVVTGIVNICFKFSA